MSSTVDMLRKMGVQTAHAEMSEMDIATPESSDKQPQLTPSHYTVNDLGQFLNPDFGPENTPLK